MKIKSKISVLFLYIFTFIIGAIFYAIVQDFSFFQWSDELKIIDLISIITTILLAVLVAYYLDKIKQNNRNEKDLIIKKIDYVLDIIDNLHNEISRGQIKLTEVTSSIKRINVSLLTINHVLEKCQLVLPTNFNEKNKTILSDLRFDLTTTKISTTGVRILTPLTVIDRIEMGIIYFIPIKLGLIDVKFNDLKNNLFEMQIEINNK